MSWAEKRIKEYRKGAKPTWIELRALEHASFVHLLLSIPGSVFLIWGLWVNNLNYVYISIVIFLIAHIYAWMQK